MKKKDLDYTSVEVDERLLIFESCINEFALTLYPGVTEVFDERIARASILQTQEIFGYARRTSLPDGRVRLEPTEKYLKLISNP
jgi:hypothetical protein